MKLGSVRYFAILLAAFITLIAQDRLNGQSSPVLNPAFGNNGIQWIDFGPGYSDMLNALLVLDDGRILTGGKSDGAAGYFVALSRLLPDGQLDSAGFGIDGKVFLHYLVRDHVADIDVQPDGKILAAGTEAAGNGGSQITPAVYRFEADGSIDTSFADSGRASLRFDPISGGEFFKVKYLSDGKIIALGNSSGNINGGAFSFGAMRFLPDGSLDNSFGSGGKAQIFYNVGYGPVSCAFMPDTSAVMTVSSYISGFTQIIMAKMNASGNADIGFGNNGIVETGVQVQDYSRCSVAVTDDGKILVAGTSTDQGGQFTVLRFLGSGSPDLSFGNNGRTDIDFSTGADKCYDLTLDPSGRILLTGQANGMAGFARLTPDGIPDTSFAPDGKYTVDLNNTGGTHYLTRSVILPDGEILSAGFDFSSGGGDFMIAEFLTEPTGVDDNIKSELSGFTLDQNYPNPFNPSTTISFNLPEKELASLKVFNLLGEEISTLVNEEKPAGRYSVQFNAGNLSSGFYVYRIQAGNHSLAGKMLLLK